VVIACAWAKHGDRISVRSSPDCFVAIRPNGLSPWSDGPLGNQVSFATADGGSIVSAGPESKPAEKLTERLLESIRVFEKCRVTSFEYFQKMIGKLFKGGLAALE
jgi:hypothetical protein